MLNSAPITITIPVTQQMPASSTTPQNSTIPFRNLNRGSGRGSFFSNGGWSEAVEDSDGAF